MKPSQQELIRAWDAATQRQVLHYILGTLSAKIVLGDEASRDTLTAAIAFGTAEQTWRREKL